MTKKDFDNIFEFLKLSDRLTTLLRRGWLQYNVQVDRVESVSDHLFLSCMLGIAIYSTEDINDVDMFKVMTMLLLHETEEIFIGDMTPVDPQYGNKTEKAREAMESFCKNFKKSRLMLDLIEEFDKNETKEAQFAMQLDKIQSIFKAKLLDGKFDIEASNDPLLKEERKLLNTPELNNKIHKLFLHNHKSKYTGIFAEMAKFLEED